MSELATIAGKETTEQRVIRVISNTQQILTGVVTADSNFHDLGMDSLDGTNLLYALEEEFNIDLPNSARNLATVRAVIEQITLLQ